MKRLVLGTALLLSFATACGSDDSSNDKVDQSTGGNTAAGGDAGSGGTGAGATGGDGSATGGAATGGAATGGQATGGQSTGGQGTGGDGTGGDASGGTGGDGTGGDGQLVCSDYLEPYATNPASVRLVNNTSSDIYVGKTAASCKFEIGFGLVDAEDAPYRLVRDDCEFTCKDMQDGDCLCTPGVCDASVVTKIAPGGHWDVGWPGTILTDPEMPAGCFDTASCAPKSCVNEVLAPTSGATLKAFAWSEPKGCPDDNCSSCTPGYPTYTCTVPGADHVGGTMLEASKAYTGQGGTITLTFE
jgi:hypothetical protein